MKHSAWYIARLWSLGSGQVGRAILINAHIGLKQFFFKGMVSISSFQAPQEKAESTVGNESFRDCGKCFGPKQDS